MTSDVRLLERLLRHHLLVQRFAGSQIKAAMPVIRQLAKDLRGRIAAGDATEFAMGRMVASDGIQQALDLEDFAVQEAQFAQQLLGASVSVDLAEGLDLDAVRAITTRRQMQLVAGDTIKRMTIPEMWQEFSEGAGRDAMRVVQAGVLEGRTQQQMSRQVAELVTTRSRRQAETVIRTATNGIGSAARNTVYQQNSDILEGERWISTLDSRVTLTCAGRDQRVYPLGRGPRPPAHYGCRSVMVPEIKEQYRIAAKGERASYQGPVSNQTTYGGFLRNQPADFQDEVLGPQRAALFRSGKVKIEQFTDDMGRTLSLDELADRYDLTMQ
jgi:SPP1 gp7 family putative phage head morphogenesis protein